MRHSQQCSQRGDGGLWATIAYCVCALYLNCVAALLAWTALPAVAGLQPVLIISGSMAPSVDAGDIVLMASPSPERVGAGAVVLFDDPAHPQRRLTHRVVAQSGDGRLTTKGDANPAADSTRIPAGAVDGVGRLLIPAVGTPALWLRTGQWLPLVAWATATALALAVLLLAGRRLPQIQGWSSPLRLPDPVPAPASSTARFPGWEAAPPASRRLPRWAVAAAATVVVAGLVTPRVVAAQSAFVDSARNPGNDFAASTSFCSAPGPRTVVPTGDAKILQFDPTVNYGTTADLAVDPRNNRAVRSLLQFSLPTIPSGCTVTAQLRLYETAAVSGRTMQVWRSGSAWTEAAVTWNTRPTTTSTTPATAVSLAAPGWVNFDVSAHVTEMYAGTDHGFLVKDSVEGASPNLHQVFDSRTGVNPPQLVLTFGSAPSRPVAPSALAATALSAARVGLTWQDNSANETGFVVQRAHGGTADWTSIATVAADVTSFTDTGLASETAYDYRVRATNALGSSPASNVASVTTPASPPPPSAPTGLTAGSTTVDTISLTWTDTATDEDEFVIERSPAGAGTWTVAGTVGPDVTAFVSTGLTASTAYDHRVKARNNGGSSAWSNVVATTTSGCSTVAAMTLTSGADTLLLQGAGGDTNYGSDAVNFGIRSLDTSNGRSLVSFAQPALPGGCAITSATLRVHESSGDTGRAIEAVAAAATWSESSVTWNTQPATTGSAVSVVSAVGWNAWDVTAQVGPAGTGAPYGFLLRDAAENNATALRQYYSPREGANPPQLVVRFN